MDERDHKPMETTATEELRGNASKTGQTTRPTRSRQKATPTEDQTNSIVSRIDEARKLTQSTQIEQAQEYADTVTDQITTLAAPLIGLGIVEKGIGSMRGGGKMAVAFLLSTTSTGIEIESAFAQTSNTLSDPLAQALLTGS
jgi:soluble cytochrome b562